MKINKFFENIYDEVVGTFNIYKNARRNAEIVWQVQHAARCMDVTIAHLEGRAELQPEANYIVKISKHYREDIQKALERKLL